MQAPNTTAPHTGRQGSGLLALCTHVQFLHYPGAVFVTLCRSQNGTASVISQGCLQDSLAPKSNIPPSAFVGRHFAELPTVLTGRLVKAMLPDRLVYFYSLLLLLLLFFFAASCLLAETLSLKGAECVESPSQGRSRLPPLSKLCKGVVTASESSADSSIIGSMSIAESILRRCCGVHST